MKFFRGWRRNRSYFDGGTRGHMFAISMAVEDLFGLAAAGQEGVEKALGNMKNEIERDMKLMGVKKISELNPSMIRFR